MLTINSAAGLQQNSYIYLGSGTALINVETLGSGGANYNMNNSLTTTSTSSTAIVINVNQPSGGTGYAILNNLYTGTGGGLVINANNGGITSPGNNYINPNGTVTLSANTINLPSSDVIGASGPSGEVILSGANGQTIGIAGAAGSLQFSASFLAGLQAQNLRIGNGNSGLITNGQWAPTNTYEQSGV